MGFTEILTLIFIVLKLVGVISWGWLLVLLPELIALGFYVIFLLLYLFCIFDVTKELKKVIK